MGRPYLSKVVGPRQHEDDADTEETNAAPVQAQAQAEAEAEAGETWNGDIQDKGADPIDFEANFLDKDDAYSFGSSTRRLSFSTAVPDKPEGPQCEAAAARTESASCEESHSSLRKWMRRDETPCDADAVWPTRPAMMSAAVLETADVPDLDVDGGLDEVHRASACSTKILEGMQHALELHQTAKRFRISVISEEAAT